MVGEAVQDGDDLTSGCEGVLVIIQKQDAFVPSAGPGPTVEEIPEDWHLEWSKAGSQPHHGPVISTEVAAPQTVVVILSVVDAYVHEPSSVVAFGL